MAPIRVGLVGIASQIIMHPHARGNWGIIAHLSSIQASPNYELVAICNSSVESAQRAIDAHRLPSSVKAYGSVEELAKDTNVDLVVISVHISKHFQLAKLAILGKKDVFVEWPLTVTLPEAEELVDLARQNGVKTIVGAQIRSDPLFVKVKELVREGKVGEVRSSIFTASTSSIIWDSVVDTAAFFLDWNSGGNEYTIFAGHCIHGFTAALGGFETVQATMKEFGTTVRLTNLEGDKTIDPAYRKTTPDYTFIQGVLNSGAVASVTFRRAKKTVDNVGLRWLITGTKGEIEVVSPEGFPPIASEGQTIHVRSYDGAEAELVEFRDGSEPEHVKVPSPGTNTSRLYEAFAAGNKEDYSSFEDVLETQKLLDKIAKAAKFP